jgi:hypothetical protein
LPGSLAASTRSDRFLFLSVPTGQYILEATRGDPNAPADLRTLIARQTVSVGDRSITDLILQMRPAATVNARIEFEGAAPTGVKGAVLLQVSTLGSLVAVPADLPAAFTLVGVRPARYYVRVHIEGTAGEWFLGTATAGGRNVADEFLEIGVEDVKDVVITLTNRRTRVTGVVSGGESPGRAAVAVFPTDRRGWLDVGPTPRRVLMVRTDEKGQYSFDGLPPGDYYVNVVDESLVEDWPAQTVMQALVAGATLLQLGPGDARTVDFRRQR